VLALKNISHIGVDYIVMRNNFLYLGESPGGLKYSCILRL